METDKTKNHQVFGVVLNLAVPQEYFKDKVIEDTYQKLKNKYKHDLPPNGISLIELFSFIDLFDEYPPTLLKDAWKSNPMYCLKRTLSSFYAFGDGSNESYGYAAAPFTPITKKSITAYLPNVQRLDKNGNPKKDPHDASPVPTSKWETTAYVNSVGRFYFSLLLPYRIPHFAIMILLPVSFFLGIRKRDYFCIFSSILIFAFLSMYAVSLSTLDRYAAPAFFLGYFLLARTLFLALSSIFQKYKIPLS